MTPEEFTHEMVCLESCWPSRVDPDRLVARRDVVWERVQGLNVRVFRAARNFLIDSGLEFMPSVPEILDACWEADRLGRPKPPIVRGRHRESGHKCSPPAQNCPALAELQIGFSYEAQHITCPGNIPATCPVCGVRRTERGIFDGIMSRYPAEQTAGWNPCFKGLMLCGKCEAA